jgi:hypothetical protein
MPTSLADIQALNASGEFMIINNNSKKTIFLYGSCRISSFVEKLKYIGSEFNVCVMYFLPYVLKEIVLNESTMQNLLNNVDIILCETLINYPGFNTCPDSSNTFFERFVIPSKTTIVHIPNLELRCYAYSNIHLFKSDQTNLKKISTESRNFLINRLNKSFFVKTANFFKENFESIYMFHTHNHPTAALMTMFFIETIMKIINLNITPSLVALFLEYDSLAGNNVPIFQIDIDNNNFKFAIKEMYDSNILLKEGIFMSSDNIVTDNNYVIKSIIEHVSMSD